MKKTSVLAAVGFGLFGILVNATAKEDDPIYRGEYFYNFENSILTPDGSKEEWCIDADMSKAMLPAKNRTGPWGRSFVVVRGKLGPEGSYGGLGRCKRILQVTEIIEVKNMRGQ